MADRDLTKGPVARTLAVLTAPMLAGVLAVMSIGLADALYLARAGEDALAATGFVYPVTVAVSSFGIGLAAGASAVISQSVGGGDEDDAARLTAHALIFATVAGVGAAVAMFFLSGPLFSLMGAEGAVAEEIAGYMRWWAPSLPFLLFQMAASAAIRSYGDTLAPAAFLVGAAALNIAIGPFLIFGWFGLPALSAEGAGLATLIARASVAAVTVVFLGPWRGYVTVARLSLKGAASSAKRVFGVALPAAGANAVNPIGMAIVTSAVATLGDAYIAGFGAATRIQAFAVAPMLALSSSIGPMVGQNWGAEDYARARRSMGAAWLFVLGWSAALGAVFALFAGPLAALAAPETAAQDYTALYLRIVGLSLAGYGLTVVGNAALNARGRPGLSLTVSATRAFLIYAPAAWALAFAAGYQGVLWAAVTANAGGALVSLWAARRAEIAPAPVAASR